MKRWVGGASVCLVVVLTGVGPAGAQLPFPLPGQELLDPQQLQQPRRAPLTLTPSITITEEYNDNVFLDNREREWDLITGFTPGVALTFEDATRRLNLAYSFTAELFAREGEESHAFDRQSFLGDVLWRVNPQLTLSLSDTFAFSTDTNLVSRENVSTGRDRAWSNTLAGAATWQFDRLTALRGGLDWTVQRFDSTDLEDSDTYRADVALDRRLTPRLTGTVGYQFAHFDIDREETTNVHTPRLGASWEATPTITLSLDGGPSFEVKDDGTRVTPAITAGYRQRLRIGAWGLSYDRSIGTAGGLGGTTDNQLISAFLDITTLARGLTVQLSPRYSIVDSTRGDSIDVRSFTFGVQAVYRLTAVVSFVAGYQFFRQRSDSTLVTSAGTPIATDADQNRVFVGIQFGTPIRFD